MNKGLGALIVAILAVVGGAFAATYVIKKKLAKSQENDFDTFENPVDDDEFEHFFGDDEAEMLDELDADDEDENEEADQNQL